MLLRDRSMSHSLTTEKVRDRPLTGGGITPREAEAR
jgi:hypothetical protein